MVDTSLWAHRLQYDFSSDRCWMFVWTIIAIPFTESSKCYIEIVWKIGMTRQDATFIKCLSVFSWLFMSGLVQPSFQPFKLGNVVPVRQRVWSSQAEACPSFKWKHKTALKMRSAPPPSTSREHNVFTTWKLFIIYSGPYMALKLLIPHWRQY